MEEEKITNKETKMAVVQGGKTDSQDQPKRLSYEELNQACMELSQQNQQMQKYIQQLRQQMQQIEMTLQTKRLDYLLKVVELSMNSSIWHFADDFVEKCMAEIQESLTIPEEENKQQETNAN